MPDSPAGWSNAILSKLNTFVSEDAAASGTSPHLIGFEARSTQKTAMSATGDLVRGVATLDGRQIMVPYAPPELSWAYAAAASGIVSSTADVVLKSAAGAGIKNYLRSLTIDHDTLSAVTECVIKQGSTIIWRGKLQTAAIQNANTIIFDPPLASAANAALNFALLSSVTGGVYVNAQGYTGL